MVKVSSFLISLLIISLISVSFGLYISEGAVEYGRDDWNQSEFGAFNKTDELVSLSEDIKDNGTTSDIKPESAFDIIGGFFGSAYKTVVFSFSSINTFEEIATGEDGIADKSQIKYAGIITTVLLAIVIIALTFAVISAMVKREM